MLPNDPVCQPETLRDDSFLIPANEGAVFPRFQPDRSMVSSLGHSSKRLYMSVTLETSHPGILIVLRSVQPSNMPRMSVTFDASAPDRSIEVALSRPLSR